MAESDRTPKAKVELETPAPAPKAQADDGAKGKAGAGAAAGSGTAGSGTDPAAAGFSRVSAWVSKTFPGHENAFWGGVLGLLAAIVLLAFGIFKTLILVVLVVAGIAVGQLVDGDPKLIRALQRLFSNNQ
ncbi:DUF2273 domain-containing protein [Paratractidigestivibacter faecalis]|uniref:DUF2273 domain-containing protein n=1 Tax=Paratractidigestivibacter faecalis TaxID=2292441 RepID=A0ABV1IFH4_9ACTN